MGPGHRIPLSLMPNDFVTSTLANPTDEDISLLDILDHVLNAGVVIHGSLVISIAGVDLVYLGMNLVLTSVETALKTIRPQDNKGNLS
jgi:gas vesicle structural protein